MNENEWVNVGVFRMDWTVKRQVKWKRNVKEGCNMSFWCVMYRKTTWMLYPRNVVSKDCRIEKKVSHWTNFHTKDCHKILSHENTSYSITPFSFTLLIHPSCSPFSSFSFSFPFIPKPSTLASLSWRTYEWVNEKGEWEGWMRWWINNPSTKHYITP